MFRIYGSDVCTQKKTHGWFTLYLFDPLKSWQMVYKTDHAFGSGSNHDQQPITEANI